jgi:hypothetical protein
MARRMTKQILEAYNRARAIYDAGDSSALEDQGGRRNEYLDACIKLDLLLNRKPWEYDLLDVIGDGDAPPPEIVMGGPDKIREWQRAYDLRTERDYLELSCDPTEL